MSRNGCCSCPNFQALRDILNWNVDKGKNNFTEPRKNDKAPVEIVFKPPSEATYESEDDEDIYKAMWHFQARAEEELSFQPGELFRICERSGAWWKAVKLSENGTVKAEGYVPHNYLARRETVKEQP